MMLKRLFTYVSILISLSLAAQNPLLQKRLDNTLLDVVEKINAEDYDGALRLLKRIEEVDPSGDATAYYIGKCLYRTDRCEEAVPYFQKAYRLDSSNIYYKESLAEIYLATGRREDADPLLASLYEEYPGLYNSPYILCVMGGKALDSNDDSLARVRYEAALELSPDYAPAQLGLIDCARFRGNVPAFISAITAFLKNDQVGVDDRLDYLGKIMQMVDQEVFNAWSAQLDYLVDYLAAEPRRTSKSMEFAGQWYYGTGREQQGRDCFAAWVEAFPDDYGAREVQMQLCIMDHDYPQAIRLCKNLEKLAGSDKEKLKEIYTIMGDCSHELGDEKTCFSYYDRVLRMDPEYVPVLNNYAYYLALKGRSLSKAAKMSRITVEKEPENASYLDTYGWILFLQGKPEEAKGWFKKAMVFGGRDSEEVLEHYSKVLRALGDDSTADYYHSLSQKKSSGQ